MGYEPYSGKKLLQMGHPTPHSSQQHHRRLLCRTPSTLHGALARCSVRQRTMLPLILFLQLSFISPESSYADASNHKCTALPNIDSDQMVDHEEKRLMLFAAEGRDYASVTARTFLEKKGLLDEATAYNTDVHKYRLEKFNAETNHKPLAQKVELLEFCKDPDALCFQVIRSPLDRAISSYIHTMRFDVFLPTADHHHSCFKNSEYHALQYHEHGIVEPCTPANGKDSKRNMSFKDYMNALVRVAQGIWSPTDPIEGCGYEEFRNDWGKPCLAQQMGQLRNSSGSHWSVCTCNAGGRATPRCALARCGIPF